MYIYNMFIYILYKVLNIKCDIYYVIHNICYIVCYIKYILYNMLEINDIRYVIHNM